MSRALLTNPSQRKEHMSALTPNPPLTKNASHSLLTNNIRLYIKNGHVEWQVICCV